MINMVPLGNAILFAKQDTEFNSGIGDDKFYRWAKRAEISIGVQRIFRKFLVVTLESNYIDAPPDAINIKYIYDGDVRGKIKSEYTDLTDYSDDSDDMGAMQGYVWSPLDGVTYEENIWDMQGGQIIFNIDKVGQTVTIDYSAFPTNDLNQITVPEFHIDPISFYIQYRMARVFRWKSFRSPKMMRGNEMMAVREMRDEWTRMRNEAKSEQNELTGFDIHMMKKYMAEMTGSFINNFD